MDLNGLVAPDITDLQAIERAFSEETMTCQCMLREVPLLRRQSISASTTQENIVTAMVIRYKKLSLPRLAK
jgi:hypothetical protein